LIDLPEQQDQDGQLAINQISEHGLEQQLREDPEGMDEECLSNYRRKLEMFNARVTLEQQIAAGELKPSPLRYDWDLDALTAALPGPDYVPGRKIELSPETAVRLRVADDLIGYSYPTREAPMELAEYWRLRDAGRVHSIYSRASRSRSGSPRTPSPRGYVHVGVNTRIYLKGL